MDHIGKHVLKKKQSLLFLTKMFFEIQLNLNSSQGPWHVHFYYIAFQTIPPQPLSFKQSPSHTQHASGKSFRSCFGWILSHLYRFTRNLEHIPYFKHVGMQHIYIMNSSSSSSNLHLPPTFWNTFGKEFQYTQSTHHFGRGLPSSQTNPNPNFCLEKVRGHYIPNKHGTNGREHSSRLP